MSEKKFRITLSFEQLVQLRSMAMTTTSAAMRARLDRIDATDDPEEEVAVLTELHRQARIEGEFHTEMLKLIDVMLDNGGVACSLELSRTIYTWLNHVANSKYFDAASPEVAEQLTHAERVEYGIALGGLRKALESAEPIQALAAAETEQVSINVRAPSGAQ